MNMVESQVNYLERVIYYGPSENVCLHENSQDYIDVKIYYDDMPGIEYKQVSGSTMCVYH